MTRLSEAISKPSAQRKHLVFGENLSYEEMGRKFGIGASTIKARVKAGMSVEAAVSTPVYKHIIESRPEQIHAHLVIDWLGDTHCSNCGEDVNCTEPFCQHCGARLDEPEVKEY